MKYTKSLLTSMLCVLTFGSTIAQAENNILTVNLERVVGSYYKVIEAKAELAEQGEIIQGKFDEAKTQIESDEEEVGRLKEEAENDILSEEAQAAAGEEFQKKRYQLAMNKQNLQQQAQQVQAQMSQMGSNQMSQFLIEINAVVQEIAEQRAATLLIDISARSVVFKTPTIMYSDLTIDISDQVIATINADAPEPTEEEPEAATAE